MLKRVTVNQKRVPVPVPVSNAAEILGWLSGGYLRPDECVTRLMIDGVDCLDDDSLTNIPVHEGSIVEVLVDCPSDLLIHTFESTRNLITVVDKKLKPMAVSAWQTSAVFVSRDLQDLLSDLQILEELMEHSLTLLESGSEKDVYSKTVDAFASGLRSLKKYASIRDGQHFARVLLNEIELNLSKILDIISDMQSVLFSNRSKVSVSAGSVQN